MDRTLEDTFYVLFTTKAFATNIPTTLLGTPVVSAYEDGSITQITAGITLGVDHDGVTGLNLLTIVATAANGYETGKDYSLVITTGTVDSVSVVGDVVRRFSLCLSASYLGVVAAQAQLATIISYTVPLGYLGPEGYGIYVDGAAANTNTVNGVDGVFSNPVSTLTAARTLADSLGAEVYYILNNSDLTLAAAHVDWEFVGFGAMTDNIINFGSQDVSRSRFVNMVLEGTQGGSGRIEAEKCALQDPGAGVSTFHVFALQSGIVDDITLDTSNDNVFIDCYSLVAGTSAPIVRASGASGTLQLRGQKGGVDLRDLSASHNVSLEQVGQVIFDASNNVNANVAIRGIGSITDNTAGMASLTQDAYLNMSKINAECDTAISDAALATAASLATAQTDLDIITGVDGVTLATVQGLYAPSKAGDAMALTAAATSAQLVDDIWDEVVSKAAHDVAQSAAKILRQSGDLTQIDGVVSDVSPSVTGFDTNLTQVDTYFDDAVLVFQNGAANAGIGRPIVSHLSANGAVTFIAPDDWPVTPINGDDFSIYATHVHPVSQIRDAILSDSTAFNGAAIAAILALLDDPRAEPGQGAPPVDPDMPTKVDYLYKNWRNFKDQTNALWQLYNDAATVVDQKATVSDDTTTAVKQEIESGP